MSRNLARGARSSSREQQAGSGSGSEERYIKSATGGYIPGPPISRQGSTRSRADIPWYGVEGDDIDPGKIYRNHSRMAHAQHGKHHSLSPASSTLSSSSMSSFIIDDPTSASSTTTLKTPTEVSITCRPVSDDVC